MQSSLLRPALITLIVFVFSVESVLSESSTTKKSSRKSSLLFQGDVTVLSDTLPEDASIIEVDDFLRKKETLVAFASGGEGEGTPQEVPVTPDWELAWKKYCDLWYGPAYLPTAGDCIFSSKTWSRFPGLQLCTTVYTGVKILPSVGNSNMHGYCFLVIGQKQVAKGLPPIVWVFNQIMGTKPTRDNEDESVESLVPSGPVKSIYCVEQRKDDGRLCFRLDTTFKMKLEFPAVLLKLMPTSRANAEKQGSAAVSKTISTAGEKGMANGYKTFLRFSGQQTGKAGVLG